MNKDGLTGKCGPNDFGYIHNKIENCAKEIKDAQKLYIYGHYPHSKQKKIPKNHPLRLIMEQLIIIDEQYAWFANKKTNKELFSTIEPEI